jgi:hypothetical protein
MRTAAVVVTLLAVAANAFSGIAALAHFRTHLLVGDYSSQLGLALGFLGLAVATLALGLPATLDGA